MKYSSEKEGVITFLSRLELESCGNNACSLKMSSLASSSVNLETLALLLDITNSISNYKK